MVQSRQEYSEFLARDIEVVVAGPEDANAFADYFRKESLPFIGLPDPRASVLKLYGQEVNLFKLRRMPAQVFISLLSDNVRVICSGKMSAYLRYEDDYFEPETAASCRDSDPPGGRCAGCGDGRRVAGCGRSADTPAASAFSPGRDGRCDSRQLWPPAGQSHRSGPGGTDPGSGRPRRQVPRPERLSSPGFSRSEGADCHRPLHPRPPVQAGRATPARSAWPWGGQWSESFRQTSADAWRTRCVQPASASRRWWDTRNSQCEVARPPRPCRLPRKSRPRGSERAPEGTSQLQAGWRTLCWSRAGTS
jgi:hypothetical protein